MEDARNPGAAIGESRGTLWTIGHSTRSFEEFRSLLAEHRIRFLADVRHFPTSQRVPWTAKGSLAKALSEPGIVYEHVEALGGFRKPLPHSVNLGWRNSGFRGYADFRSEGVVGEGPLGARDCVRTRRGPWRFPQAPSAQREPRLAEQRIPRLRRLPI